jgi:YD repeat-containing protein
MRSARQNNGKITGKTDNISGEQVVYAYDALNRLASAGATSGTWGQSYSYDGFGNLQNQTVTAGTNNRQTTDCADADGNIFGNISAGGSCGSISPSYSYDVTNRIVSAAGGVQYGYAPGNKRVTAICRRTRSRSGASRAEAGLITTSPATRAWYIAGITIITTRGVGLVAGGAWRMRRR